MFSGLNIAVQETARVDHGEPVEQRPGELLQSRFRRPRRVLQHGLQRLAALVIHHHVGGAVRLEVAQHAHDVRMLEPGERARLLQEALESPAVVGFALGAEWHHRACRSATLYARRELAGQVLLDRDRLLKVRIPSEVSDAEAADAEHLVEPVLVQRRLQRQRVAVSRAVSLTQTSLK